jgi:hypothetical protein
MRQSDIYSRPKKRYIPLVVGVPKGRHRRGDLIGGHSGWKKGEKEALMKIVIEARRAEERNRREEREEVENWADGLDEQTLAFLGRLRTIPEGSRRAYLDGDWPTLPNK